MKIGEILIQRGLLTEDSLNCALEEQKIRGGKLGANLVSLKPVSDKDLAQTLAEQLPFPCTE